MTGTETNLHKSRKDNEFKLRPMSMSIHKEGNDIY